MFARRLIKTKMSEMNCYHFISPLNSDLAESRIVLSLTPIIPNRPEKVNLYTLFHTLFIALYRHLCYNQDIEQIGGEMQWITKPKN